MFLASIADRDHAVFDMYFLLFIKSLQNKNKETEAGLMPSNCEANKYNIARPPATIHVLADFLLFNPT
jgi:hypothetical protein